MDAIEKLLDPRYSRLGSELTPEDQKYALAAFVHRYTGDHKPRWASGLNAGKPYVVQFASDVEWLAHTRFVITRIGLLDRRIKQCYSKPTWPYSPELRT